ncbi:MAG TPA: MFS transporter [Labilithrix sp.]
MSRARAPHPIAWTILYVPFGALSGFVQVALTFLATKHGLSISEGALLNGASMLSQWMKWLWAPVVDVTLSARRWYVISTAASAVGVFAMAAIPLGPDTLPRLLVVIAIASLINTVVGMSVEALMASCTPPDQVGRVSAWFQVGNLGGTGLGGALGLYLVQTLPQPWMAGAIMGGLFMACCLVLRFTPDVTSRHESHDALVAVKNVVRDLKTMLRTKGGLLAATLCILPIGTGAAQVVLAQAKVASFWGAGEHEVELMQGLLAGFMTSIGCFAGGWVCQKLRPRTAYAIVCVAMSLATAAMAAGPANVTTYIAGTLVYCFTIGLVYAAFTAFVLEAMGGGSAATKYNVFASLSNFPLWWLGLLLGLAADKYGARGMLLVESVFGVVGVAIFVAVDRRVRRSSLPDQLSA